MFWSMNRILQTRQLCIWLYEANGKIVEGDPHLPPRLILVISHEADGLHAAEANACRLLRCCLWLL